MNWKIRHHSDCSINDQPYRPAGLCTCGATTARRSVYPLLRHCVGSLASDLENVLRELVYRLRQRDLRASSQHAVRIRFRQILDNNEEADAQGGYAHKHEVLLSDRVRDTSD